MDMTNQTKKPSERIDELAHAEYYRVRSLGEEPSKVGCQVVAIKKFLDDYYEQNKPN